MGNNGRTPAEIEANNRKIQRQIRDAENKQRMALANKIVMAVVDKIAADIIRPGPKPEERECYVMAQELRDSNPELIKLVSDILKIEQKEG